MMIEDSELRTLYQSTCQSRLSALRSDTSLEVLRREAHSLKGDSRVMGLDEIAEIAQQVELVVKHRQQQVAADELTADGLVSFQQLLSPALNAIEQRVREATDLTVTQTSQSVDSQQIIAQLQTVLLADQMPDSQAQPAPETAQDQENSDQVDESQAAVRQTALNQLETSQSEVSHKDASLVLTSVFIADADLRSLYRTTSTQRLSAMTQSLRQLGQDAQNSAALEALRYESQGLKGDSLAASQGAIVALTTKLESIANQLSAPHITLTDPLQAALWQSIQLIERLIQQAVTERDVVSLPNNNSLIPDIETVLLALDESINHQLSDLSETDNLQLSAALEFTDLIEDVELRDVYKTTSEERLYRLETALSQMVSAPHNLALMPDMVREAHSLKGDAQSIQATSIAELSASLETLFVSLQNKLNVSLQTQVDYPAALSSETLVAETFTPEVLEVCRASIRDIGALIQTTTVGIPNNVNVSQLTQNLQTLTTLTQETTASPIVPPVDSTEGVTAAGTVSLTDVQPSLSVTVSRIQDEELRTVYRTVSAERLQRLEKGLAQLFSQPDNREITAELLREAHSLKGDARSVGLDEIEQLSHATEDILIGLQQQPTVLSSDLNELLLRGLDAIAQLVDEAVIGCSPSQVETTALVSELRAVELPAIADLPEEPLSNVALETGIEAGLTVDDSPSALTPVASSGSVISQPAFSAQSESVTDERLDTIRIQARDLDTLAAQTEQLTLTRIQMAQTTAKVTELVNLWSQWRTYQKGQQARYQSGESPGSVSNPFEVEIDSLINQLRLDTQENSFRLELLSQDLSQQVQTLRLLPVSTVLRSLPRTVRNLARQQSKSVELIIEGEETTADKRILEDIQDSLVQLVRNAIDHGIESPADREAAGKPPTAKLWIRSYQSPNSVVIEVADDGKGLDLEQIKQTAIRRKLYASDELSNWSDKQLQELVFVPGFSTRSFTTEISGRGVGLDVVRNQVERLKGNVQIESSPGAGCTFRLQIRTQLATASVVFVSVRGIIHAIPIEFLQTTMRLSDDDIVQVDGRETITWNQQSVPIRDLFEVLELAGSPAYLAASKPIEENKQRACLVLKSGDAVGAILVDRLLDTQEVIFKPQSALLKRVRNVVGATILGDGKICSILNPPDLIKSVQRADDANTVQFREPPRASKPLLLLVEDSPPVRIQEKRLFETAGYEVVTAEDGVEGYEILRAGKFDAVISDIEMPNLDGLSLTAKIREHSEYKELPIILVTTLSSEQDRRRGADMGANAYIVKGKFNQEVLLETLHRLI